MENWRLVGIDDFEVSDIGRVRQGDRMLKIYRSSKDIMIVVLNKKTHQLSKLVGRSFVDNPNNERFIHHIDGDKTNCEAENLKWVSYKEGFKLRNMDFDKKPKSILCYKDDVLVGKFYSIREASQKLNVAQPNITAQLKGRVNHVKGYTFKELSSKLLDN